MLGLRRNGLQGNGVTEQGGLKLADGRAGLDVGVDFSL